MGSEMCIRDSLHDHDEDHQTQPTNATDPVTTTPFRHGTLVELPCCQPPIPAITFHADRMPRSITRTSRIPAIAVIRARPTLTKTNEPSDLTPPNGEDSASPGWLSPAKR